MHKFWLGFYTVIKVKCVLKHTGLIELQGLSYLTSGSRLIKLYQAYLERCLVSLTGKEKKEKEEITA
jgi:hypothetical protein